MLGKTLTDIRVQVVSEVRDVLGPRLTAYLAGVTTTRQVRAWADDVEELPIQVSRSAV